jgi:hypothetical protein
MPKLNRKVPQIPSSFQDVQRIPTHHDNASQPAEDKAIEKAFLNLGFFISSHVDQFYKLVIPAGINIFDFEPTESTGVKAALRRYIASNVFKLVAGMTGNMSRGMNSMVPMIARFRILNHNPNIPDFDEDEFALRLSRLLQTLEPYTYNDEKLKDRWRHHLEDILRQGSDLERMVSSQPGSRWQVGSLEPPVLKSRHVDILVFPSLLKNGKEVQAKVTQRVEGMAYRWVASFN